MKRIARMIVLACALACLAFGTITYFRLRPKQEESPQDRETRFFNFLNSVSIQSPALTTVSTARSGYREISEAFSSRGCQCYGHEARTLKSADGVKLQVATSLFAITSAALRENQSAHRCIHPISDPWFELNEMFIDGQLVRAIEDKELRINLGNATTPALYAKWQDPDGGFTNAYTAWSTGQTWMIPLDRSSNESCKIPNISTQQIQDGIELLRIDIRVVMDRADDVVPVELIKQVLEPFNGKLSATATGQ